MTGNEQKRRHRTPPHLFPRAEEFLRCKRRWHRLLPLPKALCHHQAPSVTGRFPSDALFLLVTVVHQGLPGNRFREHLSRPLPDSRIPSEEKRLPKLLFECNKCAYGAGRAGPPTTVSSKKARAKCVIPPLVAKCTHPFGPTQCRKQQVDRWSEELEHVRTLTSE